MNTINSTQNTIDPLADFRLDPQQQASTETSNELGESEFLELLVAQLENQSPLEPQDNGEFIAQLAQFSSLEEIQGLNNTVEGFSTQFQSSQALQASAMVGRTVLVPGSEAPLTAGGSIDGQVELAASTGNLRVSILNGVGEIVDTVELGQQFAGTVPFTWDGTNTEGERVPAGQYTIRAESTNSGQTEQVNTLLSANVNSVSIAQTGAITLNLE